MYFEKVWFQNGMPNMHKLGKNHIIKKVETILSMTKTKNDMPYRLFIRHKRSTRPQLMISKLAPEGSVRNAHRLLYLYICSEGHSPSLIFQIHFSLSLSLSLKTYFALRFQFRFLSHDRRSPLQQYLSRRPWRHCKLSLSLS